MNNDRESTPCERVEGEEEGFFHLLLHKRRAGNSIMRSVEHQNFSPSR